MVAEGFFAVEYTTVSPSNDDDAILAEDGSNIVTILFVLTVIILDLGITSRDEIKLSVNSRPVVPVSDTRLLTLFTFKEDNMTALVEGTVKPSGDESDLEGSMRLLFDVVD